MQGVFEGGNSNESIFGLIKSGIKLHFICLRAGMILESGDPCQSQHSQQAKHKNGGS